MAWLINGVPISYGQASRLQRALCIERGMARRIAIVHDKPEVVQHGKWQVLRAPEDERLVTVYSSSFEDWLVQELT